jgi:septal ring factor EnvC (AmiA/AmiB activator)
MTPSAASGSCQFAGSRRCPWREPSTPKKSLQASLERLKARIQGKKQEIKELETQTAQVEQAIKALG